MFDSEDYICQCQLCSGTLLLSVVNQCQRLSGPHFRRHMYIANNQKVSNWFINARRRAPQKEAREREANGGRSAEER